MRRKNQYSYVWVNNLKLLNLNFNHKNSLSVTDRLFLYVNYQGLRINKFKINAIAVSDSNIIKVTV